MKHCITASRPPFDPVSLTLTAETEQERDALATLLVSAVIEGALVALYPGVCLSLAKAGADLKPGRGFKLREFAHQLKRCAY